MKAYIYQDDIYCERCGKELRAALDVRGGRPAAPRNHSTYDSKDYPKGPYPDGGGKADTPQHCGRCHVFLRNPLTPRGVNYVIGKLGECVDDGRGDRSVLDQWVDDLDEDALTDEQSVVFDLYQTMRVAERQTVEDR